MPEPTFHYKGTALPAVEEDERVPLRIRLGYAWKALRGDFRIVGPVDISHLGSDGYMEGRLRAYFSKGEIKRYFNA